MSENNNKRVLITSTIRSKVAIYSPDLKVKREWPKKGSKQYIPFNDLEEIMFDSGIEYLFKTGILYIADMDTKIALGLEEDNATAPSKVIVLTDQEKKDYLQKKSVDELKTILGKLSLEQAMELTHTAIELEVMDMARVDILKNVTGVDVAKQVLSNREGKRIDQAEKQEQQEQKQTVKANW